jgi:hypothetical protein
MTRDLTERCDHCAHSRRVTVARSECRRFPPPDDGTWPIVPSDGWCGEFKKRDDQAA